MKKDIFTSTYLNMISEEVKKAKYGIVGLSNFEFPKHKIKNVKVGDKLVYVYTSTYGFSGNWNIPYWTIKAEVVEVEEVKENGFKLNNGMIIDSKNTSSFNAYTKNTIVRSDATDLYDFSADDYEQIQLKEYYGKGIYPASFLLKYYADSEKGYSSLGGGGSYEGPDYESLKELAQNEKTVQKMIAKKNSKKASDDPEEKDVQRILDILTSSDAKGKIGLLEPMMSSGERFRQYEQIRNIINKGNMWSYEPSLSDFKKIDRIEFYIQFSSDGTILKKAEKMAKLIKDYDKAVRRMKAIPIAFEKFKNESKYFKDAAPYGNSENYPEINFWELNSMIKFKENASELYKNNPIIVKRVLNNIKISVDNWGLNTLKHLEKDMTEIFEEKVNDLKRLIESKEINDKNIINESPTKVFDDIFNKYVN